MTYSQLSAICLEYGIDLKWADNQYWETLIDIFNDVVEIKSKQMPSNEKTRPMTASEISQKIVKG